MVEPRPPLLPAAPGGPGRGRPRSSWLSLLLLMSLAGARAAPDPRSMPPAAGVAGGAGGAELAELTEVGDMASRPSDSLPHAAPQGGATGTIREALGGGVAEAHAEDVADVVTTPGPEGPRAGGSRCRSPQACTRVEQCLPAGLDVLFECAVGKVCCAPAAPTQPPPRTRPPQSPNATYAPRPQQSPQPQPSPQPPSRPQPSPQPPSRPQPSPQPPSRPQPSPQPPSRPQPQRPRPQPPQQAVHPPQVAHPQQPYIPPPQPHQPPHKPPQELPRPEQPPQRPQNPQTQPNQHLHSQQPPRPQHPQSLPYDPPGQQGDWGPAKPTKAPTTPSLLPDTEVCGKISTENRITHGKIAEIGQFPWMALLGYRQGGANVSFLCGGTLINERYVLTAAHCFSSSNAPVMVRLGEFNLTEAVDCDHNKVCAPPPLDIAVESVTPHPDFDSGTIKHDIALIRLAARVPDFSEYVRPICLPLGVNVTDDRKFKIAGWGKTDFKDAGGSPVLQYTDVGGVGHAECNELQPPELRPLDEGQLCAGGDKGKDACKGDSGGPLMVALALDSSRPPANIPSHVTYQIGVVSYGPDSPCGTAPLPSIYTRVSSYVPWILATLRP